MKQTPGGRVLRLEGSPEEILTVMLKGSRLGSVSRDEMARFGLSQHAALQQMVQTNRVLIIELFRAKPKHGIFKSLPEESVSQIKIDAANVERAEKDAKRQAALAGKAKDDPAVSEQVKQSVGRILGFKKKGSDGGDQSRIESESAGGDPQTDREEPRG
jgi:hypothetical protein